ncbi:MAG: AAA family ATPase [Actinomycetota bacterium]|nr:AAA family ATPase [Actinomycetota bacterium]
MPSGFGRTGTEGVLLGRREELAELRAGLDDVCGGRSRLFLLAGEGGIGKTALLQALIEEAHPTEVRAVWGGCREARGSPPFWPWVQVLSTCVRDAPRDALERYAGPAAPDLAVLVPDLQHRIPGLTPRPPSESPDARLRLFDAVRDFLANVASDGGLIVGLDDVHAADEASLRLLQHLAGELGSANVLLVATYRDADVRSAPQLQRLVAAIARHGRKLVLSGLDEPDATLLLERTVRRNVDAGLARHVHLVTDGNPLFVQEIGRVLVEATGSPDVVLPEEVHQLIRSRLEPLPTPAREVLQVAAAVNRPFDLVLLRATAGLDDGTLAAAVGDCVAGGMIAEDRPGVWDFVHDVGRQAVYDGMRASQRVALHRRIGEALERLAPGHASVPVAELAHHFFEAARGGDGAKARLYCARAGDAAMAHLAFEEAALQYGRALEAVAVTPPVDEGERYRLLLALAVAQMCLGDISQAWDLQRRALKSARALGSADLLAQAAVRFVGWPRWVIDETAASVLTEARAALPDDDNGPLARILMALAEAARTRAEAVDLSRLGMAMARRLGDPETLRWALSQWHGVNRDDPDLEHDRLEVSAELVQLSEVAGDAEGVQRARLGLIHDLLAAGDVVGAAAELERAAEEATGLRLPSASAGVGLTQAALALLQSRLDDAERLLSGARAAAERASRPDMEDDAWCGLYALRREQGRAKEMADIAQRMMEGAPAGPHAVVRRALLAVALAEMGNSEHAREELLAVAGDLLRPGGWNDLLGAALVADASWLVGDAQWAEMTYERLRRWPNRHVVMGGAPYSLGASDRYLGQLAALLGRFEEAETHFGAAHRRHEMLGAPEWEAHGRLDHARMLLSRSGEADVDRARALASAARDTYRALSLPSHEERAAALLESPRKGSGDPAPETGVFILEGEYWAIEYGGVDARVRDSKGLRYLARLLRAPGQELHALDLVVGEGRPARASGAVRQEGLETVAGGDAGAVLDATAKAAYKRRLTELREELDEATQHHDVGRVEKAQAEMDFLMAELSAAVGLGGRDRKAASDAERARQSVTRAIKGAVERIAVAHPALGEHLRTTVRTGIYSSYAPDPRAPIQWTSK